MVENPPDSERIASLTPGQARATLGLWAAVLIASAATTWNWGALPRRDESPAATAPAASEMDLPAEAAIAPDLRLYRDVTAAVAQGENYYAAAKPRLLAHGFPIRSVFNWRLPTYAWLFALLPGPWAIQGLLLVLLSAGLVAQFITDERSAGMPTALAGAFLGVGIAKWGVDGLAFYTQELWAAGLIWLSLGLHRLGKPWAAIGLGLAALLFRELALPYCVGGLILAVYHRRGAEALGWGAGIALFFGYLAWHAGEVRAATAGDVAALGAAAGATNWLRFGGLDFLLLTTRMNGLCFTLPGGLLCGYLLLGLLGLSPGRAAPSPLPPDARLELPLLVLAFYLAAFSIVGMPVNFYWGLLFAPLLPSGVARGAGVLVHLWRRAAVLGRADIREVWDGPYAARRNPGV